MAKDFSQILDDCIDSINRGDAIEACLAKHPEHARQLEPLLRAMSQTKIAYSFSPAMDAKRIARQRFYAAIDRQRLPSFWQRMLAHRVALTSLASVLILFAVGYITLRATVFVGQPPGSVVPPPVSVVQPPVSVVPPSLITIAAPSVNGNFVFLISDEVNDIADFSSLNVTIEKVELLPAGNSTQRIEFTPEVKEFDLTLLPGEKTQELWRGNIPEGEYSTVVIYVSRVYGVIKTTGEVLDIKLPSNKLQISKGFQVSAASITSFTYDLTVVKTGNANEGSRYILKPQAGESGATQKPQAPSKGKGK